MLLLVTSYAASVLRIGPLMSSKIGFWEVGDLFKWTYNRVLGKVVNLQVWTIRLCDVANELRAGSGV